VLPRFDVIGADMTDDEDRSIFWLDYIIASDDPADKALVTEYNTQTWTYGQTTQALMRQGGLTQEAFDRMGEELEVNRELHERIHARALELKAAGYQPATPAQVAAWRATWLPLAQNIPSDDDPIYRA